MDILKMKNSENPFFSLKLQKNGQLLHKYKIWG
jgi:hypothetical protein